MVVELATDGREPCRRPRGNAGCEREWHEQLRMLVTVAAARLEHLDRARDRYRDALLERVVHPVVDASRRHDGVARVAAHPPGERDDPRVAALDQRLRRELA